jgi:hypothetical protein
MVLAGAAAAVAGAAAGTAEAEGAGAEGVAGAVVQAPLEQTWLIVQMFVLHKQKLSVEAAPSRHTCKDPSVGQRKSLPEPANSERQNCPAAHVASAQLHSEASLVCGAHSAIAGAASPPVVVARPVIELVVIELG